MDHQSKLLLIYCVAILAASLAGGWIPFLIRLSHRRMQLAISLVAGFMLGVALLHLVPHALAAVAAKEVVSWLLVGFLAMFFLERFFSFHHHDAPSRESLESSVAGQESDSAPPSEHRLTWSGAAVGLTLHSVIAGVVLAASVWSESRESHEGALAGLAVFLVIVLHKPFDAMSVSALMTVGGWSLWSKHLVNGLFSLAVPIGVVLFHLGVDGQAIESNRLAGLAIAFASGVFLCIAMSDLLPELQFHCHDRFKLSAALLLGLALAWTVSFFEARGHRHGQADPETSRHHNAHLHQDQEHSH